MGVGFANANLQKLLIFFFSKNISLYVVFNDRSFNDMLINDIVSFELLGPGLDSGLISTFGSSILDKIHLFAFHINYFILFHFFHI